MKLINKSGRVALFEGALEGELGVCMTESISAGQVVYSGKIKKFEKTRTKYTIQYGENHVLVDLIGRSVNHSCSPNIKVSFVDDRTYEYIAIRDLFKGKEVFFDYTSTETEFSSPFRCLCNSQNCNIIIGHRLED